MLIGLQGFVLFRRKLLHKFSEFRTEMLVDVNPTTGLDVTKIIVLINVMAASELIRGNSLKLVYIGWD